MSVGGRNRIDTARIAEVHRTIPRQIAEVAVTAAYANASLAAYAGQFIWLRAVGADITVRLGTVPGIVAGKGLVLTSAEIKYEEVFVDPSDVDMVLSHISSGAATLQILYD